MAELMMIAPADGKRGWSRKLAPRPTLFEDILKLEQMLHQMLFDDALVRRGWRVEYLTLVRGLPHFRLYQRCHRHDTLIGIVDVRTPWQQDSVERDLAVYIAGVGFTPRNTRLVRGGARTAIDASKRDLPHLFVPRAALQVESEKPLF